jgi:hypothetical protein
MAEPNNIHSVPAPTSGSRSKLLSTNFKNFLSKPAITHPQKALTVQLYNAEQQSNMPKESRHRQESDSGASLEESADPSLNNDANEQRGRSGK